MSSVYNYWHLILFIFLLGGNDQWRSRFICSRPKYDSNELLQSILSHSEQQFTSVGLVDIRDCAVICSPSWQLILYLWSTLLFCRMHDLGQQNTNNEMLGKNISTNQNFCEINQQSSPYPGFFQQNSVSLISSFKNSSNTVHVLREHLLYTKLTLLMLSVITHKQVQTLAAGNEATNTHFMTNQRSPAFALNNHAINSHSAWNSQR